jgi:hypothetical protein
MSSSSRSFERQASSSLASRRNSSLSIPDLTQTSYSSFEPSLRSLSPSSLDADAFKIQTEQSLPSINAAFDADLGSIGLFKTMRVQRSILTSTIDLCNTILGTGIVSLPYAFSTIGK